jgi:hypothetical protein
MANKLSKTGIVSLATIRPWHVSQSVDAFTGLNDYDITISGSLTVTGSVYINSLITSSNVDVVTIDPITGQLFSTSSNSFNSITNITSSTNNYYTSSVNNAYSSSTVVNNYTTSSISNSYTSSTVTNNLPSPSDQYIQYNSSSAFGADSMFQYVYSSQSLQQGNNTIASGIYSHTEGSGTQTIGNGSHAEGEGTQARGDYSHTEGSGTQTIGNGSHAEGESTIALGNYSHAEGEGTTASGIASHAEGAGTDASGDYSHAEGLKTITSGPYQHVSGRHNIASTAQSAFIIGNGLDPLNQSNLLFASGSTFQISASLNLSGSFVPRFRNLGSVQVVAASPGIQTYPSDYNVTFQAGIVGMGNKNEILLPARPQTGSIIYLQRISGTSACRVSGSLTHTVNGSAGYTFPTSLYARRMFVFHGAGWYTEPNPIV